jgi:hypothetical protein
VGKILGQSWVTGHVLFGSKICSDALPKIAGLHPGIAKVIEQRAIDNAILNKK